MRLHHSSVITSSFPCRRISMHRYPYYNHSWHHNHPNSTFSQNYCWNFRTATGTRKWNHHHHGSENNVRDIVDKEVSSSSSSSKESLSRSMKRLSSTPPLNWSKIIPQQPYHHHHHSRPKHSQRNSKMIKEQIHLCPSIPELIDFVYNYVIDNHSNSNSNNNNNNNDNNDKYSVTRNETKEYYDETIILVSFWEKMASFVKDDSKTFSKHHGKRRGGQQPTKYQQIGIITPSSSSSSLFRSTSIDDEEDATKEEEEEEEEEEKSIKDLRHNCTTILHNTISQIHNFHPGQIRNIAFAKASILKDVEIHPKESTSVSLLGDKRRSKSSTTSIPMMRIMMMISNIVYNENTTLAFWEKLQQHALSLSLDNFRPNALVSIAWSLATVTDSTEKKKKKLYPNNRDNDSWNYPAAATTTTRILDVTPFFVALQTTFLKRRNEFTTKHLGNLAWSTMTVHNHNHRYRRRRGCSGVEEEDVMKRMGKENKNNVNTTIYTSLLQYFSNEFVSRWRRHQAEVLSNDDIKNTSNVTEKKDDDVIDPMTLCQWATSYAKAEYYHVDEELFRTIAFLATPLLIDQKFEVRYLANMAYAFALAEVPFSSSSSSSSSYALLNTIANASMEKLPYFTTQNYANMVWAYAKLEHSSSKLFDGIAKEVIHRLKECTSQELANLAWAYSKFHSKNCDDAQQLSSEASFSYPASSSSELLFERIAEEALARGLNSFTMQGVAMLAHAFATVGQVSMSSAITSTTSTTTTATVKTTTTTTTKLWDSIDEAIISRSRELGYLECSHIARSYAMICRRSDKVFNRLKPIVASHIHQFLPPGLSSLAWAYATLGYDVPDLFSAIAKQCVVRIEEFHRVDEVMLVLALSRIHLPLPEIREHLFARARLYLIEYSAVDLFNILIFYVRGGDSSKSWMDAMANEITCRSPTKFSPKMAVGIAHSYASTKHRNPVLLNYLLNIVLNADALKELDPKEISSLAWSFATLEFFDRKFFGALANSSNDRWHEFDAASLATMAWTYASAREDRPELFESIVNSSLNKVDNFSSQGVSMLLWACSTTGCSNQRLFHAFEERVETVLHECDSQSLANIAWAYTVADYETEKLFGSTSKFIDIVTEKFDTFTEQGLCQLHQFSLWRKNIGNNPALPPHIVKQCYDTFRAQPVHRSKLQSDIVSELVSMGIHLEEESCTKSGFSLDALIELNGNKIAVEVDGPHHFMGRNFTGNSTLKHRQVATVDGIPIISLPYWELSSLKTSSDKQQYLRTKLGIDNRSSDLSSKA